MCTDTSVQKAVLRLTLLSAVACELPGAKSQVCKGKEHASTSQRSYCHASSLLRGCHPLEKYLNGRGGEGGRGGSVSRALVEGSLHD